MAKILYVEDDSAIAANVEETLSQSGYLIEIADCGEDALQLLSNFNYDLILLDWDLPGISGLDVCKLYRKNKGNAWIIFLTGKSEIDSIEAGLEAGGDDYIVKPFESRELLARVKSALRRPSNAFVPALSIQDVSLDETTRNLKIAGIDVHLMPKEVALLAFLIRHCDSAFSARDLLSAVWSSESGVTDGTVRTFMGTLRQKLKQAGKPDLIKTIPNAGYIVSSK